MQFYVVRLILALVLALGTVFLLVLLVLLRVLEERRDVADTHRAHAVRSGPVSFCSRRPGTNLRPRSHWVQAWVAAVSWRCYPAGASVV
jgi:hypothetical protein